MQAPQIIVIALMVMDVLYSLLNAGKPRYVYSAEVTLMANLIWFYLLQWGGFWDGKRK